MLFKFDKHFEVLVLANAGIGNNDVCYLQVRQLKHHALVRIRFKEYMTPYVAKQLETAPNNARMISVEVSITTFDSKQSNIKL